MKDVVWVLSIAMLTLPGGIVGRVPRIARMRLAARLGLAFAAGIFIAALLMYVYALAGVPWSRATLGIPLAAIALFGRWRTGVPSHPDRRGRLSSILIAIFFALTLYAIADARATCGDIVFIWAPKAQAFAKAATIDLQFLAFPHYYLMHPDYPPLVPQTYALGTIAAHRFSWWGALYLSIFILAAILAVLREFATTTLVTAILAFAFVSAYLPGGADPFLILFESIAVIALTFEPDSKAMRWIASFALAAAAFTKVEGASFAIIVAIAFAMTRRKAAQSFALLIPAAALLGSWLTYMAKHGLLDQYARANTPIQWHFFKDDLKLVLLFASYRALWLPWIAAFTLLAMCRPLRNVTFPLLVAAGSFAATMFFYLHNADPAYWIASSADRILVTPLMCVAIASAAAWNGVEPDRLPDAPVGLPA